MDKAPVRKSRRTAKELELLSVGAMLNKVADGLPVLDEHYKKSAAFLAQPAMLNMTHIPMNVEVDSASYPLPLIILEEVIRRSPHRVICKTCNCREGAKCQTFPYNEFGCIHIGAATEQHNDECATHASVDETIAHLRKAVAAGLFPWVGHVKADEWIWDITEPFLTVCLCCTCCCNVFYINKRVPKEQHTQVYRRLKGLHVITDESKCTGCGKCIPKCFSGCISIEDKKARTDDELCTGCGVCVTACPEKARTIIVDDLKAAVDEFINRVSPDVGGLPTGEYQFDELLKPRKRD